MVDSRSTLPAPSETSTVGRFRDLSPKPAQTETAHRPLCPSCGRAEHLAFTLLPTQTGYRLCRDKFHGQYEPAKPEPTLIANFELEKQLIRLIFDSRNLAITQFPRRHGRIVCAQCDTVQTSEAKRDHKPACSVGRVLELVAAICEQVSWLSSQTTNERSSHGEATAHAAAEVQPLRFPGTARTANVVSGGAR
jgi:hypothetical protein